MSNHIEYSEAERNAMRAFVARCEVRLSTLHRIAGSFLSGAGFLILFPVFFKDVIYKIIVAFLESFQTTWVQHNGLSMITHVLLVVPMAASMILPLWAFYVLLKELVLFYFIGSTPTLPEHFHPRFALSGIAFSPDESPKVRQAIYQHQYENPITQLSIANHYIDDLLYLTPRCRTSESLQHQVIFSQSVPEQKIQQLGIAYGLADSHERILVGEVAKIELSLVRNIIALRKIVLRYFKTILIFLWTALIYFLALPFIDMHVSQLVRIYALVYVIWAVVAIFLVQRPLKWIFSVAQFSKRFEQAKHDPDLSYLETVTFRICSISAILSILTFGLTLFL